MASNNQAAWLDGKGAQLRIASAENYTAGPGEVVIKNSALAINPVDWKIQDYGAFFKTWPNIMGTDVAGTVVEVASDVTNVKVGDRVLSHMVSLKTDSPRHGAFQLYSVGQATTTTKIPDSVSFTDASVLPLAIDTAASGLYDSFEDGKGFSLPLPSLNPKPTGQTIVVWGGSSSVGAVATQLGAASGAHVVAVASARNFDFCKSNGASSVFDYNNASVAADVAAAVKASGGQFVGVYDAISNADSYKHSVEIFRELALGGVLVTTLPGPKAEDLPQGVKTNMVFGACEVPYPLWKNYITLALEQGKLKCVPEALVAGKGLKALEKGMQLNKQGVSAKKVVIEL